MGLIIFYVLFVADSPLKTTFAFESQIRRLVGRIGRTSFALNVFCTNNKYYVFIASSAPSAVKILIICFTYFVCRRFAGENSSRYAVSSEGSVVKLTMRVLFCGFSYISFYLSSKGLYFIMALFSVTIYSVTVSLSMFVTRFQILLCLV